MTTFVYLDFCMTMNTVAAFAEQWQILTHWISTTISRLSDEDLVRTIAPNRNHGISDPSAKIHLYTLMTKFLNEKLKGKKDGELAKP